MATKDTQQRYVHADVLNVRDLPTLTYFNTAKGQVKSKVIGKLKRGQEITILIQGQVKFTTADGTQWTQHSPRLNKNGDKWVFITKPAVGWIAYKHSGEVLIGSKPPTSGGTPGGPPDTVPMTTESGGLGAMGFLVVAGVAYVLLGRGT